MKKKKKKKICGKSVYSVLTSLFACTVDLDPTPANPLDLTSYLCHTHKYQLENQNQRGLL